jgi:hypothetical protein
MVGFGKKENIIYLIDFGLTKKKQEVTYTPFNAASMAKKKMAGTPIYASISAHLATGGINIIFIDVRF